MSSHFGTIGIGVTSQEELGERVVSLIGAGTARRITKKISEHVWTDPSGARLVAQVHHGGIEFLLPCLAGTAPAVPVGDVRLVDDETAMLDLLDGAGGELICPIAVELEDRAVLAHSGGRLESGSLVLAALAEEITVHADADAYSASQDGEPEFAADHFIPSGTFPPGEPAPGWTPSAHALFAGEVVEAGTPVNTVTGTAFHRIRVRTIAAIELDVAIATTELDRTPAPGNVVSGTFFLTGSLGLQPENPVKRRGWFRR